MPCFSREEILYGSGLHTVEDIAIDEETGNLYWVDIGKVSFGHCDSLV